jgi:hypothetical protein
VSFEAYVKPLFREHDGKSMSFAFWRTPRASSNGFAAAPCPATAPGRVRRSRCFGAGRIRFPALGLGPRGVTVVAAVQTKEQLNGWIIAECEDLQTAV